MLNRKEFLRGKPFDEIDALEMQDFIEEAIQNVSKDIIGVNGITKVAGFKPTGSPINMSITVDWGVGYTSLGDRLVFQNGIANTVQLQPSDVSYNRIDVITIKKTVATSDNLDMVNKYELGSSFLYSRNLEVYGVATVYTGVPSVTPVKPVIPTDELEICEILVKAGSTNTNEAGIITDKRKFLKIISLTGDSSNKPLNPVLNQQYFDTTLNKLFFWDGSFWKSNLLELKGTTAERPAHSSGLIYYDTTINKYIFSNGTEWKTLDTDAASIVLTHENKSAIHTTQAEKDKLAGIATNANNYVHPSSHSPNIIVQDANNRFVTDAQIVNWNSKAPNTVVTTAVNGLMDFNDKIKLNNISSNANNYVHPSSHPPSIITQDANNRFMTDAERVKLSNIAANANNYVHPTGSGNNHIPTGGTTNNVLRFSSNGTAVWGLVNGSEIVEDATHRFATDAEKAVWNGSRTNSSEELRVEVRTTDPTGLLAAGRIWFRSDL